MRSADSIAWRPGLNVFRSADVPAWRPCLTRARGEDGNPTAFEHAWFLDVGGTGYCWSCRTSRPRAVFGPEWWIADIRAALDLGEMRRVRELVARGPVEIEEQQFAPNRVRSIAEDASAAAVAEDMRVTDAGYPGVTGGRDPISAAKDDVADFHGYEGRWTRRRTDVFDVDAIDPVLAPVWCGATVGDYDEFVGERAAIFEYLGGIPRPVAEVKARQLGGARPREGARR